MILGLFGLDFFAQKKQTTYDIDGNQDRDVIPDILLKFPERNYIIDAKVSLADWTKYVEALKSNTEEDKKTLHLVFKTLLGLFSL